MSLPLGFALVNSGFIQPGDYVWADGYGWRLATRIFHGRHAVLYGPTARGEGCE